LPNKQARCIAFSPKHGHIAVGSNFGKISIRSIDDLDKKIQSLKEAQEWCEIARYSPDEKYLAVGSHDDKIWVYEIDEEGKYSLYCKFARHASFINSLDWSLDSRYIRSTDGGHERLYYSMETKHQDTHGVSTTADLEWATYSIK
jgi:WD40 repeat protein